MLLEKTKIYGVDNVGQSSPTLTRTDAAVGLGYTIGTSEIQSDFDRCFPWCEMKEVTDEFGNVFKYNKLAVIDFHIKITDCNKIAASLFGFSLCLLFNFANTCVYFVNVS